VKEAAQGKIAQSYDRLEKLGCVRELPDEPRRAAIAGEYLTAFCSDFTSAAICVNYRT
jgi:hypothetical protein